MTDYGELVKALRCCDKYALCNDCPIFETCDGDVDKAMALAADAIEALQAEMPKRGKWIEDATTYAGPGLSNYKCSLCGKICGTWRRGLKPSELPNWCGNCGADMRAKMEVQDGKRCD